MSDESPRKTGQSGGQSTMAKVFDQDNVFFRFMGVVFDLIQLNLLTLLCCLPVVTAGASLTAMHTVLWRMIRHEETYISRQFFASFKRNFKQATAVWAVYLLAIVVLTVDVLVTLQMPAGQRRLMFAFLALVGVILVALAQWYFPMLSRYDNTVGGHVKNAASLAIGCFPRTLCEIVILVAFVLAYMQWFVYVIPFLIILGISLPEYCCAWLYNPVFQRLDGEVDAKYRPIRRD
ncbi:DUF624 domain-containing protein [Bifidobacterium amazonense]|uniref:DUF624 domain-containing protein n=1 Tax=Bifidobacterium amazonense TaxID=2809027 RepID=A0ABS9VVH5_9BIFI|nr:DUF624 domain-containing protein [Bifidobacterium amazonense]MCH9275951.1 DUF624 domain-containing protein [Bifidobacterium amazonense]